ncbi:MAG: BAX protein [uncultured Sulfurovum sp.]|uniref:BAX protein n=1 Tax=uncultured Sulfurovum sp. TaxID=269237 RepID=A0A6S6TX57_9BACT|nr:MAG: BAX protein [uncultured Sulfurovum sp.]
MKLNNIIYALVILLLLQVSLLGIYMLMDNFFTETSSLTIPIAKDTSKTKILSVNPGLLTVEETLETGASKEAVALKLKLTKVVLKEIVPKSLEEALIRITPTSKLDIVSINNQSVKPILYTKSIKLSALSIQHKKKMFIDMIIPSILVAKHRISQDRKKVAKFLKQEKLSANETLWLTKKRQIFKASDIHELHDKMELHPTSIVIAQAIIESGWGTSRFFEKANNVFGIWSFNKYEKRIVAGEKRGEKHVYLKKYSSVEQSISDYFLLLSTKDAYKEFREKRLESQDPFVLVEQLGKYSELGEQYIENLKNTIKTNQLLAYDSYVLDF